ncbi:DUF2336 domain-containing protein [Marivibrio halodurans]|uniref:DUF2336 domain-containing protein n=1 Tax=Marivibrio halodurans TaxID=2039722 RepID=A0A8J7V0L1_9PROT|nr:DUF2336 domain-containing protein [Marivibrio halodurans]MBP5856906.1 DUF2336 domain-containing protein [Marivibrio halodurans]
MGRQVSYEKLLRLAHQRVIDGKGGLAASIAKMCLDQQADLTDKELDLTYQILRQLIDRVEVQIRRHVADILAERDDVPRDLLAFLINDAVHVAYPIIVRSRQLTDDDLVALVGRQTQGHAIAIAGRPNIGEPVSTSLVALDEAEVDRTLLRNETARIDHESMAILVERSIEQEDYRDLIVRRPDLPEDLARRMYRWVGEALRHHISRHFEIDSATLQEVMDQAVWHALDNESDKRVHEAPWTEDEAKGDGARLQRRAGHLLHLLQQEGAEAFLAATARRAHLPLGTTAQAFRPDSPETTAIACRALGMDIEGFVLVLKHFRAEPDWTDFATGGGLRRACDYFERIDPVGAATVLRQWRQAPPDAPHGRTAADLRSAKSI